MKQTLGDRMKANYEKAFSIYMPYRFPVIIRLDGKNFHGFTRKMKRPFDEDFIDNMKFLTKYLCEEIQTTVFAYSQSDEISLLLHPYKKLDSQPWFLNEIQKVSSIAAGLASSYFSLKYQKTAIFDARCFIVPEAEVVNYFIWRQQDMTRNSIHMFAQSKFSHKELQDKNTKQMQEMVWQKDKSNWNDLDTYKKRGFAVYKISWHSDEKTETVIQGKDGKPHRIKINDMSNWEIDLDIPIFSKDRDFIHKWLNVEEE